MLQTLLRFTDGLQRALVGVHAKDGGLLRAEVILEEDEELEPTDVRGLRAEVQEETGVHLVVARRGLIAAVHALHVVAGGGDAGAHDVPEI